MGDRMLTDAQKVYAAGFFDGEGSIQITPPRKSKGFSLHVSVAQSESTTLEWLCTLWGGSVGQHGRPGVSVWRIHTAAAGRFLADIEPYLRIKRQQAQLAIAFQNGQRIGRRLNSQYIAECEALRQQLRALHGNIGRRAAVIPPDAAALAG
jgi:hypothetical protein